ncbi:hypothetical protein [Halomonas sp. E19]|uniref:hypothetical protein n=1 Tax=Halomonas sp. E19 TaxID=3397247 RepID=UPI0040344514
MTPLLKTLFDLPRSRKRVIQIIADTFLIVLSFLTAMLLRLDSLAFIGDPSVWLALPIMVPVSLYLFIRLGFYRAIIRYLGLKAFQAILAGVAASALTLGLVSSLLSLPVPRSVPFIYAMLALMTIGRSGWGCACCISMASKGARPACWSTERVPPDASW